MATIKIRVHGEKKVTTPVNVAAEETETLSLDETYVIGTTTRGEVESRQTIKLDETKVVEFTYDDNSVWIGDHTTIDEIFPGTSAQLRSVEAGEDDVIDIPTEVQTGELGRSGGLATIALKVVKIFSKKTLLAPLVRKLAGDLEDKVLGPTRGLVWLSADFKLTQKPVAADGEYLLFLHGTGSSTEGSFSELQGTTVWSFITQTYKENVLAFQHETLTKSPLENVLDLVSQLPQKATLTLVSHSRGGLVGDILNRFCLDDPTKRGFSANEKNFLSRQNRTADLQVIADIETAILGKNITIDKFIRVACTASGTTLASRRLDIYFNVLFNVIGLAAAQATNPLYVAFKDLVAALIESKDDASVLPGLEMQNPQSPFNQMLNNASPEAIINTPLIVISGDAKLSRQWSAIKVALANLFFWSDNDFVVDTRSMYNGAKRADGKVQYFFDEGADVSHFNYFKNDKTRNALFLALKNPGDTLIPSFSKLENRGFTEEEIRNIDPAILAGGRVFRNSVSGKKPIVVLLPGIMGSTLTVNDKLVWVNFFSFIGGGLTRLLYSDDNNKNVRPDSLVGSSYKKLTEYLIRDYDVVTFPFDWRLSMDINAAALNRKLTELMDFQQPIKLIGHSMGGVLIRDFIINHSETWGKLNASKDFRLVFLGSPLGGSFRIPYVLFGLDSLISKLDLIDISNSRKDLLKIFSRFPGILSLLPLTTDSSNDFADPGVWKNMREAFGDIDWPTPADDVLTQFKAYRTKVLNAGPIDYKQAVYIAGQSRQNQQTISGYQIGEKETCSGKKLELEFLATKEGDESVTWDSGIPPAMLAQNTVYYSDVAHGELANDPKLFGAITDILNIGSTIQLKKTRPALRGAGKPFKARAVFDFDLSPEGVEKTLMGLGSDNRFTASDVPITISVSNGDLKYAMYPLLAGHFENDGILSAEKVIDWNLHGELGRRHQLGLYPGAFGTSEVVESGKTKGFQGSIIIGLGRQGFLTEVRLTSAVEQGASKYLAILNSKSDTSLSKDLTPKRIGLSALLIGSGYGGLRVENSIRAIIQGVQNANTKIRQIYDSPRIIDTIEFVELYKDRALACVKAIGAIEKEESRSLNIFRSGNKIKQLIGWRERLPVDDTTEWWTRINVGRYADDEDVAPSQRHDLRFTISTDAARVEERSLKTLNDTLIKMLEGISRKDDWSPELAKAIFELMIPNDFKDQVKRQNNINWIVDKYTAAFPWELLQDNLANARPLSVNAGMIRQLATGDFRININPVAERTAIVIGDPDLKNPAIQLPAAQAEGEKVADLFGTQGFDVTRLLRGSAEQILLNLFSKNYKIVHLAGHGVFNSDPNQPTGMLIGPHALLTPSHIDQMSNVPDLVFVNCCYLGQADGTAEKFSQSRFRLAANIGTQLIQIGVKAVVVAGWAVNDSAALEFAERFYQYMFERYTFGEAIKKARKTIFEKYGSRNNTWGAYQCYGDPFYKLSNDARKTTEAYSFIIPEEAEIELSNLLHKVESGGYDPETIGQTMDAIEKALIQAGIQSGRITELQALLYSALNKYELAIKKFDALWKEEKSTFSFSATEKYCNTKVKLYAQQVKKEGQSNTQVKQEAIVGLKEVIKDLENLNRFGATVERTNILASAYKRLAMISDTKTDKQEAYSCSASYYRKAYDSVNNKAKYYPLVNWLSIENALVLADGHEWGKNNLPKKGEVKKAVDDELENIRRKDQDEKEYWDWLAEATLLLGKRLLGDTKVTEDSILSEYKNAWDMIGTQGQRQAEIENLEFLEDALEMGEDKSKEIIEVIRRIKQSLEEML
ncbi:DUF7379 domain-containing protein [Spirosoma validum]|uniref:CHAT domain-containing protein n=1 Tax=Spirosoma validum TaxID=2771355 RepID=A0A927GES3_9BACT|nr:CHAT domain-containing protein [Spirosoma validum]MBD2754946.1 CHAT domain-containing protein [Spirosoma validum]